MQRRWGEDAYRCAKTDKSSGYDRGHRCCVLRHVRHAVASCLGVRLRGDYISELATGRFGYVQPLAFFTIALGSLSLALAFAALITFFLNGDGQWTGLYQPAFLGTILLWLVLVAIRLRSIATRSIEGREITDDRSKTAPSS